MENQIHKGVEIFYDEEKRTFFTKAIISKTTFSSKKMDNVKGLIDKTLLAYSKQPSSAFKRAWMKGPHEDSKYKLVDIIFNDIKSNTVTIRNYLGKISTIPLSEYKFNNHKVFLSSKKNDKIVELLEKQQIEIDLLKKKKKLMRVHLVPLSNK